MSDPSLTARIEHFMSAFWDAAWDQAQAMVTADFQWEMLPKEGLLLDFPSLVAVTTAFQRGDNGYPPLEAGYHRVLRSVEAGDVVAHQRVEIWKARGKWFHLPCAGFFQFRDGLIASWTDYFDMELLSAYRSGDLPGDDQPYGFAS